MCKFVFALLLLTAIATIVVSLVVDIDQHHSTIFERKFGHRAPKPIV